MVDLATAFPLIPISEKVYHSLSFCGKDPKGYLNLPAVIIWLEGI